MKARSQVSLVKARLQASLLQAKEDAPPSPPSSEDQSHQVCSSYTSAVNHLIPPITCYPPPQCFSLILSMQQPEDFTGKPAEYYISKMQEGPSSLSLPLLEAFKSTLISTTTTSTTTSTSDNVDSSNNNNEWTQSFVSRGGLEAIEFAIAAYDRFVVYAPSYSHPPRTQPRNHATTHVCMRATQCNLIYSTEGAQQ